MECAADRHLSSAVDNCRAVSVTLFSVAVIWDRVHCGARSRMQGHPNDCHCPCCHCDKELGQDLTAATVEALSAAGIIVNDGIKASGKNLAFT